MKRILTLITILVLASCVKNYPIANGLTAIGSYDGTTFTSDEGIICKIVESTAAEPLQAMERVYIAYDVISHDGNMYSIRLLSWTKPLVKKWLRQEEITDEDAIGHDPIRTTGGWISGGYINIELSLSYRKESETKHVVNLVLANPPVQADSLRLSIRHNGNGESVTTDILNADKAEEWKDTYSFGTSLVCFPTEGILPDDMKELPFAITGDWYYQDADTKEWSLKESKVTGVLKR